MFYTSLSRSYANINSLKAACRTLVWYSRWKINHWSLQQTMPTTRRRVPWSLLTALVACVVYNIYPCTTATVQTTKSVLSECEVACLPSCDRSIVRCQYWCHKKCFDNPVIQTSWFDVLLTNRLTTLFRWVMHYKCRKKTIFFFTFSSTNI